MKFDSNKEGLHTLFKPYQALLLEWIWDLNKSERKGVTSGDAHKYIQTTPESKSRASVIFFLNELVEEGILRYEEETGKGGYHRVYYPKMDQEEFAEHVIETINGKLRKVFPEYYAVERKVTV
ncbi:MAG: BlaI/MecI/CopY family transcriptional regulator [Candidatus Bathyarchaeota archaeon]|jgi:predicted transcriptional regulator